jgi:regulator of protease activity HflC (stomatin/prohibitin superfamily)
MTKTMKRVRINAGKVGLVFRSGDFRRVITEGVYWVYPFEKVVRYDMSRPFYPFIELNLLLRNEHLRELLLVVEVGDNEIAFQFENGLFKGVLTSGRYTFWKGLTDFSFEIIDLNKIEINNKIDRAILARKEVWPYVSVFVVEYYQKGLLYIDGKRERILETGSYYFWKNDVPVKIETVDLRQSQIEIVGQEILTKDKAGLRVNFIAQYKVVNIESALIENKDFEKQLYVMVQLALRAFIGTYTLDELLEKKDAISVYVLKVLKEKAGALGVQISACGVKDIILPGEVKDIMNQVLIAQKQAQANVIMRREETASTRSLLNTAKLMEDNEMLFKLKEMEFVEKIADKVGEINVAGNGQVIDQLRGLFTPVK